MSIKTLLLGGFLCSLFCPVEALPADLCLKLQPSSCGISVSLENRGQLPQGIFPGLSDKNSIPPFMWIKAIDSNGEVLTKFEFCPDGFYTPLARSSSFFTLPVHLESLAPGERREISVSWTQLLSGVKSLSSKIKVRVKMQVYTNERLDKYIEGQSDWFSLGKIP